MSVSITIRNIDDSTVHWLENKAMHQGIDIESVVLQLIQMEMKKEQKVSEFFVYDDLDFLAGTWSEQETKEFLNSISDFERVDTAIWQ